MSTSSGTCEVTPGRILGNERVTNAKLNDLGNPSVRVGIGAITERELAPDVLNSTTPAPGSVTESSIVDKAVSNSKLADMAATTLKGRRSSSGVPEDLTPLQATDSVLAMARANVSSATTTDLGAATSTYLTITGTTTITGLGTANAGIWRNVLFEGALTLTHNATSLIIPGAANITTAAGDVMDVVSEGSGNWRVLTYVRASGAPVKILDEDDMASDSASMVPSQQSVKAYINSVGGGGYVQVRDEKSSGTNGGALGSNSTWTKRTINTEVSDAGGLCTISSSVITLAAGTYRCRIIVPTNAGASASSGNYKTRLYNTSDSTTTLVGTNGRYAGSNFTLTSFIDGKFTILGSKNFEVQMWLSAAASDSSACGTAASTGEVEIYTVAEFWKVG